MPSQRNDGKPEENLLDFSQLFGRSLPAANVKPPAKDRPTPALML
jgi:hypothetical protein